MEIIMREAEREIERALFKEVRKLHHNKDRVRRRLESSLRTWANDSPAVRSLQDDTFNSLKGTFGLTDEVASEAAVDIAKAVGNCLDVRRRLRSGCHFLNQVLEFGLIVLRFASTSSSALSSRSANWRKASGRSLSRFLIFWGTLSARISNSCSSVSRASASR